MVGDGPGSGAGERLADKGLCRRGGPRGDPRARGRPSGQRFYHQPDSHAQAGIQDYEGFARKVLDHVRDRPISFEVCVDDFDEMNRQAHRLSSWGAECVRQDSGQNTEGISSSPLIADLTADGPHSNATGFLTLAQVRAVAESLSDSTGAVVSVFAGRIADTGRIRSRSWRPPSSCCGRNRISSCSGPATRSSQRLPGRVGRL